MRSCQLFDSFSASVLVFTGVAKLISLSGPKEALANPDPILFFSNGKLMLFIGIFELFLAFILVRQKNWLKHVILCCFCAAAVTYRLLLLHLFGFREGGCKCLGFLSDWIPLDRVVINTGLLFVLFVMFFGSSVRLVHSLPPRFRL